MQLHTGLLEYFILLPTNRFFISWIDALQNRLAKQDKVNWNGFLLHIRNIMLHSLPREKSPAKGLFLVVVAKAAFVFTAIRQGGVEDDTPGWIAYPIHLLVPAVISVGPAVPLPIQVFDAYSGSNFHIATTKHRRNFSCNDQRCGPTFGVKLCCDRGVKRRNKDAVFCGFLTVCRDS